MKKVKKENSSANKNDKLKIKLLRTITSLPDDEKEMEIWTNFFNSLKSDETKEGYTTSLRDYMKQQKITTLGGLINRPVDMIRNSIKNYLILLNEKELSTSFIQFRRAAIKHFYDHNGFDEGLHWKLLNKFVGNETKFKKDRAYTKEEIKKVLDIADFRLKVCVLLQCTAGLRVGALPTIKVGHLHKKDDCYLIEVYKDLRGNGEYETFCNQEAAKAIDDYLDFRKRHGEIITDDSLLIIADFDTEKLTEKNRRGVTRDALRKDVERFLVLAGLRTVDHENRNNRKIVKGTHGLRKAYDSALVKAGIHPHIISRLMGHSSKSLDQRYVRLTEDELFNEYKKAIQFLTIDQTINLENKVKEKEKQLTDEQKLRLEYEQKIDYLMDKREKDKQEMEEKLRELWLKVAEEKIKSLPDDEVTPKVKKSKLSTKNTG